MKKAAEKKIAVTIAEPVAETTEASVGQITEPTIFNKIESFKKELDAISDLGRGGRWNRAVRNIKDMQKDLGTLAREIQNEYLEEIDT